ncbi:MAG: MBL fold metallo-hydrolase [Clostridia bacterium]|nr:MBL fold metallo-hydrolase [Clostridia bacterium]
MNINCFPLGDIGANCYVLIDDVSKHAVVIDPGVPSDEVNNALMGYDLKYILLTHGHFDHIFGSASLKELYPDAKLCIHKNDEICLNDRTYNLIGDDYSGFLPEMKADIILNDGDVISFGEVQLKVLYTPGHSEGSVCYVDELNKIIFSGDTLFCLTVGRTDFITGSFEKMMESVKKLSLYDDEYAVYPGHNRSTTIGFERKRNRYMRKI